MGAGRYEVLLVDAQGHAKQMREWSNQQLLASVSWLKRMNARGHDVMVRPSGRSGLALLHGLTKADVERIECAFIPCTAKIQVAADGFQVWLDLGSAATSGRLRDVLTTKLGLPKTDGGRFGSLAGFVRHQLAEPANRNRFVLAHEPIRPGPESVAKWGRMLEDAEKVLRTSDKSQSRDKGLSR